MRPCTNSLSIVRANMPEVKMKNDGVKKQCNTQIVDSDMANLSVVNCVLIISNPVMNVFTQIVHDNVVEREQ